MSRSPLLLTGMGLVTAYGFGVDAFWTGIVSGKAALSTVSRFDTAPYRAQMAGQVQGLDQLPYPAVRQRFIRAVVDEATAAASLDTTGPEPLLVVLVAPAAPTSGDDAALSASAREWLVDDLVVVRDLITRPLVPVLLNHACASGAAGLAYARTMLNAGRFDSALVLGAEVLNQVDYSSMDLVRALSPTVCRPFDLKRDGMLIGEGAGAVILQRGPLTRSANARQVELRGVGSNMKARWHVAPDEEGVVTCLLRALENGGVHTVDYVQAHANGSPYGDQLEVKALSTLLPGGSLVSSCKGAVGHLLRSSTFPAVIAATQSLLHDVLPPTVGCRDAPEVGRLSIVVGTAREASISTALVNSTGFCGNNVALVLARV